MSVEVAGLNWRGLAGVSVGVRSAETSVGVWSADTSVGVGSAGASVEVGSAETSVERGRIEERTEETRGGESIRVLEIRKGSVGGTRGGRSIAVEHRGWRGGLEAREGMNKPPKGEIPCLLAVDLGLNVRVR